MNLLYSYLQDDDKNYAQSGGSISLGISLGNKTGCFAECFGFINHDDGINNTSYINGGFTRLLSENHQVDFRAGVGLNDKENDFFIGVGTAFRF
jgi:hypothetical protein